MGAACQPVPLFRVAFSFWKRQKTHRVRFFRVPQLPREPGRGIERRRRNQAGPRSAAVSGAARAAGQRADVCAADASLRPAAAALHSAQAHGSRAHALMAELARPPAPTLCSCAAPAHQLWIMDCDTFDYYYQFLTGLCWIGPIFGRGILRGPRGVDQLARTDEDTQPPEG